MLVVLWNQGANNRKFWGGHLQVDYAKYIKCTPLTFSTNRNIGVCYEWVGKVIVKWIA